jgi:deoxycytidine triphosphate deaminase
MVLSDRDILRFQKGDTPLIPPFDLSRLRSASYDVTIDDEVTVLSEAVGVENSATKTRLASSHYQS